MVTDESKKAPSIEYLMILMALMDDASFGLVVDTIHDSNYDSAFGLIYLLDGSVGYKKNRSS